ncbi:MAG: hypothetical protein IT495_13395 [Gammaproteobacteria bacterium]|nr:hypothetical protein [Gammaproteobacteria bacterium]
MDRFSEQAADEFLAAFPEWREFARSEQRDDGSSYFVLQIDPPAQAAVEHGLLVHTDNDEVTVGFDFYHSHFDSMVGDGEHFGTTAAVALVRQIVSERVAVVSWWLGESWAGSSQIEAGAQPSAKFVKDYSRIRVRSWKGTFNADIGV